jgi:hypothetical protein
MTKKNIKRIHNKICNDEQCVYNVLPATFRARATGIKFNDVHILSILYIKQDNYQKDFFIFFSQSKGHIHQDWMHIHVSHQIKNKFPSG